MKRKEFLKIKMNANQTSIQGMDKVKKEIFQLIAHKKDKPIGNLGTSFDNLCDPKSAYYDKEFASLMRHMIPAWIKPTTMIPVIKKPSPHPTVLELSPQLQQKIAEAKENNRKLFERMKKDAAEGIKKPAFMEIEPQLQQSLTNKQLREKVAEIEKMREAIKNDQMATNIAVDILGVVNKQPNAIIQTNNAIARGSLPFQSYTDESRERIKERLLSCGYKKPHFRTQLSIVLYQCTTDTNKYYDSIFDQKIRLLRPHWFKDESKFNKISPEKPTEKAEVILPQDHMYEIEVVRDFIDKTSKYKIKKYTLKPVEEIDRVRDLYRCAHCKNPVTIHQGMKRAFAVHQEYNPHCPPKTRS